MFRGKRPLFSPILAVLWKTLWINPTVFSHFPPLFQSPHKDAAKSFPRMGKNGVLVKIDFKVLPSLRWLHIFYEYALVLNGAANLGNIALKERILGETFLDFIDGVGDGAVVLFKELANSWQAHL